MVSDTWNTISNSLSETGSLFVDWGVKILGALILLLVLIVVFRIIMGLFNKGFKILGVDKFADKFKIHDSLKLLKIDMKLSALLSKIIYLLLLIVAYQTVVDVLGLDPLEEAIEGVLSFIVSDVIPASLIILVGLLIAKFVKDIIVTVCTKSKVKQAELLGVIAYVAIVIATAIPGLEKLGVDVSIVKDNITILIAGVALAFGLGGRDVAKKIIDNAYDKLK